VGKAHPAARAFLALAALCQGTAAPASETITYSYDARGCLVATSSSGGANNGLSTSIGYDPARNRQNYTVTGAAAGGGTLGADSDTAIDAVPVVPAS
jgi:hypothetical protein